MTGRPRIYIETREQRDAREQARRAERDLEAQAAKEAQQRWPDWVRFEDDPRAVTGNVPRFVPIPWSVYG